MMRTKLFAAGAAFCMLGITGCSNEMMEDGAAQAGKQTTMTLQGTTDGLQTRADYTDDNTKMDFSWRNGDKMSVVVDGVAGNDNCELTTTAEGKSVAFSGTVATFSDTKTIYAFYPYNSATPYAVTGGDDKATATAALTLPNPQLYTIGGAISNSFMVGVGSATANGTDITASASLKQVMSIIKLNITNAPAKVTGVKLKCTDAIFATTATVKLSDATITNPGALVSELSMTVTDNSTTDHAAVKAVSFAIFPKAKVDGKEIQIEVTYEDGKSKMIKKDDIAFERNMHYVMDFDGTPEKDYIEVNGIKVAVGNLVADGANGAKIGTKADGGLYFQFGSLVGWSGGATGDGTGTAVNGLALAAKVTPNGYTAVPWNGSWEGDPATENTATGTGDPCKYYLKGTWRLPTNDEHLALLNGQTDFSSTSSPWKWDETSKSATHTDGLTFPASGYRLAYDNGILGGVGTAGGYWSASLNNNNKMGYSMNFHSERLFCNGEGFQSGGASVRCVQASN